MHIKLDENLPVALQVDLRGLGHDVDGVVEEGLAGRSDIDVWIATQNASRFLITQDLDFSDARRFAPGTHAGILLIRLREPSRRGLVQRLNGLFSSEAVENWSGCFVVATESKLRVRRPKSL